MNLTPIQIASRNLFAALSGVTDPATVELAFLNPNLSKLVEQQVNLAFSGPFGIVPVADEVADHGCKWLTGYLQALDDFHKIDIAPFQTSSTEFAQGVAAAKSTLLAGVELLRTEVLSDNDDEADDEPQYELTDKGSEALAEVFSSLLGYPVQVVLVEPTSR